jgi:hypothetical protein
MKTLLLIGDSVRKDAEPLVRRMMAGVVDVRAPEENCRDSRVVLAHLDDWVFSRPPDLVHINCGLHDLKREFGQARNAVPLDEYRRNVRGILSRLVAANLKVIWATTTPVNEVWHHQEKSFDRFEADVDAYNATRMPSASAAFFSCSATMRSSMLPATISLYTNTGLSWPMRWARSVAWFSTAGFHQGS